MSSVSQKLALRSSTGVEVWSSSGLRDPFQPFGDFKRDESKVVRSIVFSPCGSYFAYANGRSVNVCSTKTWKIVKELPRARAFYMKFSPKGTFLMVWEQYIVSKDIPENTPNLYIYKMETGDEVYSVVQKRQSDWEPNFSSDESLMAIMIGGEVFFYEPNSTDSFTKYVKKLGGGKNGGVSMSPENSPLPHFAFYVPGVKGAPSMCRLYKYPNLETNQPVASKSFFQADNCQMMWNKRGNGVLIFTSTEVDTTGASYYGKQALHFLSTKGDSFVVQLNTEGPIHSVAWSPKSNEFCVVYGYMPAKATMFNLKCDSVFDFGTGNRNSIYFNSFGNLVLFGGFGNLRGNIEIWDLKQKKQISTSLAPDTTLLEWAPTGDIYFTATCAPRLRMSNGFKVWHYSGALLHETMWPEKQELLELIWQTAADGTVTEPVITSEKVEGIASSQPQPSAAKYVPPGIRHLPPGAAPPIIPGLPPGYTSSKKNAPKKGNRGNNKSKSQNENSGDAETDEQKNTPQGNKKPRERASRKPKQPREVDGSKESNGQETGTPEGPTANQENGEKPNKPSRRQRKKMSESSQNPDAPEDANLTPRPRNNQNWRQAPPTDEAAQTPNDQEKTDKPKRVRGPRRQQNHSVGDGDGTPVREEHPQKPATHQQHDHQNNQRPPREHRPERPQRSEKPENAGNQKSEKSQKVKKPQQVAQTDDDQPQNPSPVVSDPDKEKKKKINKKLKEISTLKEKMEKGEKLDGNQMNKINSESELISELKKMKV